MVEFGVKTGPGGYTFDDLKRIWLEAERLGFDSGWLYDHLYTLHTPSKSEVCLENWTTLTALATLTHRLKIGTLVLCNQFRQPSLLAKMAATLDVISDGRVQFGIGAGNSQFWEEAKDYGIDFPEPKTRIMRLREAIQIIRLMWETEEATFKGKYYSIDHVTCNPRPVQKPHPPIWVGIAHGTKLMPKVIAELADGGNFTFLPPEDCGRRIDLIKTTCSKIGRRPQEVRFSWQGRILIAPDQQQLNAKVTALAERAGKDVKSFIADLESEGSVIGTPDECVKKLRAYVDLGIEHFALLFLGDKSLEPLQVFADQVMPQFR